MSFYVYENWQAGPHKAVLYVSTCGFCNDGRGLAGGSDPKQGKWHGPYPDLVRTRRAQARLSVALLKECRCVGVMNSEVLEVLPTKALHPAANWLRG